MASGGFNSAGNTFFQAPFATGARNGLSIDAAGNVVLGNDVGAGGNPASWLNDREIDTNGFNWFFVQAVVDVYTEIRVGILAVFNRVDNSEGSMQPGIVSLIDVTNNNARVVLGSNQVNESEVRWDGNIGATLFGDIALDLLFRLIHANGNVIIGLSTLPDNGSKLQVEGHVSMMSATANLDFPLTAPFTSSDLTIALAAAVVGDMVVIGYDPAGLDANSTYTGFVDSPGSVTVRFNNYTAGGIDPAARDFTVSVLKPL